MTYQSLIIIGAPRSGTNMLRNALCSQHGFGTWPCDEINLIWRHGNTRWPSDQLPEQLATKAVRNYINYQFGKRALSESLNVVVEKTCANSLRVPFVDKVLPNARYLFIHRDPVDVVASAIKRWQATLDFGYTLRKMRFMPWSDAPIYAAKFFRNRLHRSFSSEGRVASWGPVFPEMARVVNTRPLEEVCALQWKACVESAVLAFKCMPESKYHAIAYEEFVQKPQKALQEISEFLQISFEVTNKMGSVNSISTKSIGKGTDQLAPDILKRVIELTSPTRELVSDVGK